MSGNAIHLKISRSGSSAAKKSTVSLQVADPPMWKAGKEERGAVDWEKVLRIRQEMIHSIRLGQSAASSRARSGLRALQNLGGLLCDELLSPKVKKALREANKQYLVLVLDDAMAAIPWELLRLDGEFLCCRFAAGRWVESDWDASGVRKPSSEGKRDMWIVANPCGDLPSAGEEGLTLFRSFQKRKDEPVRLFLDGEIGRDDFRAGLSRFDVVHFAGHVRFDEKDPAESALRLKDELFSARDFSCLEGSAAAPEFVFLNACQSAGTGPPEPAETFRAGAFGIADAAMRAGVRHFLGNLWEIDDKQGGYFALNFYRTLFEGKSIGEAVKSAREVLSRDENNLCWAGYVLYGDPEERYFRRFPQAAPERLHSRITDLEGGRTEHGESLAVRSQSERQGKRPESEDREIEKGRTEKSETGAAETQGDEPGAVEPRNDEPEKRDTNRKSKEPPALSRKKTVAACLFLMIFTAFSILAWLKPGTDESIDDPMPITLAPVLEQSASTVDSASHVAANILCGCIVEQCPQIRVVERIRWDAVEAEYRIVESRLVPKKNKIAPEILSARLLLFVNAVSAEDGKLLVLLRIADVKSGQLRSAGKTGAAVPSVAVLDEGPMLPQKEKLCGPVVRFLNGAWPVEGKVANDGGGTDSIVDSETEKKDGE